jgi:hypothetical protein
MRNRVVILPLLILLVGLLALFRLQWIHQLGGLASSPQEVEVKLREKVIVGGGRAALHFGVRQGEEATFAVRCRKEGRSATLREGQVMQETCGVVVHLRTLWPAVDSEPEVAWLEISWQP